MKWRKKAEEDDDRGFERGASPATPPRITPLDIQEKEFHRSSRSRGGYVMREVDEFLDEVTDTLTALLAENERLRQGMPASPSDAPAATPTAGAGADRTAVEAFLRREKAFLQELGGVVQAHAEELKSMVRSARATAPPAEPATEPPDEGGAASDATAAASDAMPAAAGGTETPEADEPEEPDEPVVAGSTTAPETEEAQPPPPSTEATAGTPPVTVGEADEPIRLEEPAPARRRGTEDDPDRSLRELFWGEE